jgi:membrane-associated protein
VLFANSKCGALSLISVITTVALPDMVDPMYWLGEGGLFGSAVLVGVMVIIFIETGLLFPFLPGDTLLFTAGMIAAQAQAPVDIWALAPCATIAAILGSQCAYFIGRCLGPALFRKPDSRLFKQRYLTSSKEFFARHGPKTLLFAQFIGVVRTFAPVIAGVSTMDYTTFLVFGIAGSAAWGVGLTVLGYFLGNVSFVADHLELAILVIAMLSLVPAALATGRVFLARRRRSADVESSA